MKELMVFVKLSFVGLFIVSSAFAQESTKIEKQELTMNQNKKVVLRLFDEVFNQQSFSVIDEIYNQDVVDHCAFPDQAPGIEGAGSTCHYCGAQ